MNENFIRRAAVGMTIGLSATLGGCATTGGLPDPGAVIGAVGNVINNIPATGIPEVDQKINSTIAQVQTVANRICGFVPLASTVAGIVGTFTGTGPIVGTVTGIADMICKAVKKPGAARRGARTGVYGSVRGVAVKGQFTR